MQQAGAPGPGCLFRNDPTPASKCLSSLSSSPHGLDHGRLFRVLFGVSVGAVSRAFVCGDRLDWEQDMRHELKIDIAAAGGVDLDRLGRSLLLHGERVGDGRYHVTGGSHDHWVDLYTTSHPRCDCGDHLWREQICKHILAALLREGHDNVVDAVGRLFRQVQLGMTSKAA
jgi:hypothetical protein